MNPDPNPDLKLGYLKIPNPVSCIKSTDSTSPDSDVDILNFSDIQICRISSLPFLIIFVWMNLIFFIYRYFKSFILLSTKDSINAKTV